MELASHEKDKLLLGDVRASHVHWDFSRDSCYKGYENVTIILISHSFVHSVIILVKITFGVYDTFVLQLGTLLWLPFLSFNLQKYYAFLFIFLCRTYSSSQYLTASEYSSNISNFSFLTLDYMGKLSQSS